MMDLSGFIVEERGAVSQLYSDDQVLVQKTLKEINQIAGVKAYLRKDVPAKLQYNSSERIGDIVIIAEAPYYVRSKKKETQKVEQRTQNNNRNTEVKRNDSNNRTSNNNTRTSETESRNKSR